MLVTRPVEYSMSRIQSTITLTNSIEYSPSPEVSTRSCSEDILCCLWKSEIHDRVHKRPPKVPTDSHINAIHIPIIQFIKINFNIIFLHVSNTKLMSFIQISLLKL